jgi:nucleoside-diphosphate-sugar epimerase
VRDSARILAGRADRYLYVSSRSVYASLAPDLDETSPTVPASPDAERTEYPQDKRGGEMAVQAEFADRAVLARAGLILGPHENVGRLPWWLARIHRGGQVLAPGPPDLPLQYIDARDLAAWLLNSATGAVNGPVNVVSRAGHATMRYLLETAVRTTGANAELVWVDADAIQAAGIRPWTELPLWIPPGHEAAGLLSTNVERAYATGLHCRPVEQTVADTWAWLVGASEGDGLALPGGSTVGLDPAREQAVLAAWLRLTAGSDQ